MLKWDRLKDLQKQKTYVEGDKEHKKAAFGKKSGYDKVNVTPVPLDTDSCLTQISLQSRKKLGHKHYNLVKKTGLEMLRSPLRLGTIGLIMDCDTTGIDLILLVVKKLL